MMFSVYEISSGAIKKVVSCAPEMLELQFDPKTHAAIDGAFDDGGYYVEEGTPVEMPPRHSAHHVFDYNAKQWVDPRTPETEWPLVRARRDQLLQASDWTQLPDVPLETKEVWAAYRQALRDVTEQPDPFNIVWPALPV